MKLSKHLLLSIFFLSSFLSVSARFNDTIRYRGELVANFSGGKNTPFWLVNNQQGMSSVEKNNGYLRLGVFKDMNHSKRFSWGAGVELATGYRQQAPFFIQQLYGEIRYRCLSAMLGAKEMWGEVSNPRLASGNMLYSGNARPIPQFRIGIFDYANFWGTKGWLGIKGYLAFGKFTDGKWQYNWTVPQTDSQGLTHQIRTEGVLWHSKGIWFRVGNEDKFPLVYEGGMEMATQFGGRVWVIAGGKFYNGAEGVGMPSGVTDWLKAIFPFAGGGGTVHGERTNVQGNMVGNYTFAFSWRPKHDWALKVYYQHYFDDHSMMFLDFPWRDGLWGVEARLPKNPFVSNIVYEFLTTKDQSGPVYWDITDKIPVQVSGRDRYYEHYLYTAYQHWGRVIGNPLILSPIYNNGVLALQTNRIQAHHLGFEGQPHHEWGYRVLLSFSRNWGTYSRPFIEVKNNFNCLVEAKWSPSKLPGWSATLSLGGDAGALIGNSIGAQISICKTGLFRP